MKSPEVLLPPPSPSIAWTGPEPPKRILAIRLQAMGDLVITLPYLAALQRLLPAAEIDLLTREEVADIPRNVVLFRRVFALGGGRDWRKQLLHLFRISPTLLSQRYDAVLDLQNNRVTKIARRLLHPKAWCEFDRFNPLSAGERTRRTIESAGFPLPRVDAGITLRDKDIGTHILRAAGWEPEKELVILSPSGAFPSRNWPLENYAAFAKAWNARGPSQFAVLGLPSDHEKAERLRQAVGPNLLNLTGQTTPSEALAIVQRARLSICEDGGLMHMAWTSGVPVIALFGSSMHVWSAPQGEYTLCFHSADLPCGECMMAHCQFGDVRCLTRYSPEFVLHEAEKLLERAAASRGRIYDQMV